MLLAAHDGWREYGSELESSSCHAPCAQGRARAREEKVLHAGFGTDGTVIVKRQIDTFTERHYVIGTGPRLARIWDPHGAVARLDGETVPGGLVLTSPLNPRRATSSPQSIS